MKGFVTKEVDSKVGYKGFIRKGGIMIVIILANLVDHANWCTVLVSQYGNLILYWTGIPIYR